MLFYDFASQNCDFSSVYITEKIIFGTMHKPYTASFTSGALLFDEMERVVSFLASKCADRQLIVNSSEVLTINSAAAKVRQGRELLKRYDSVEPSFWEFYRTLTDKDSKKFAVYYACLRTYPMLMDFQLEVVLTKWRQMSTTLNKDDVFKFLKWASIKHPEIDEWKDSTLVKISRIAILMLKETGLLTNGILKPALLSDNFWIYFLEHGEGWFLEAMLLSKEQRQSLLKKA